MCFSLSSQDVARQEGLVAAEVPLEALLPAALRVKPGVLSSSLAAAEMMRCTDRGNDIHVHISLHLYWYRAHV